MNREGVDVAEDARLPGEDDEEEETEDQQDAEFNVGMLEDLRSEYADRARQFLGLPEAKGSADADVEFVLMYLAACADFYITDRGMASDEEYTAKVALHDLDILRQAISQVATVVRRAEVAEELQRKRERRPKTVHLIPLASIKDLRNMSAAEAAAYSDAMRQASEEVQEALRLMNERRPAPPPPSPKQPDIQVIRRKRSKG